MHVFKFRLTLEKQIMWLEMFNSNVCIKYMSCLTQTKLVKKVENVWLKSN